MESVFNQDEFMAAGHNGDLSFMTEDDWKKICDVYGEEEREMLQQASWNCLPFDIKEIIFAAKVRSAKRPVKYQTTVIDGKCGYCKSELEEIPQNAKSVECNNKQFRCCIFENSICKNCNYALPQLFDCHQAMEDIRNGLTRKDNCQSLLNTLGVDVNIHREFLNDSENKITYKTLLATADLQGNNAISYDEINKEKTHVNNILAANVSIGRKVSVPKGMEYTKYTVETKVLYEAEINKKDGKVMKDNPVTICKARLYEYLSEIPKGYKVVKVIDIGCGGNLHAQSCRCDKHQEANAAIEHADKTLEYSVSDVADVQYDKDMEVVYKEWAKIHYVQVVFQRIDKEIDERIIGLLNQKRLVENRVEFVLAWQVQRDLEQFGGMIGRNNKAFVNARLAKLARDGKIELEVHRADLSSDHYDSDPTWTTTKRNSFRAKNDFAVYTTYTKTQEQADNNRWTINREHLDSLNIQQGERGGSHRINYCVTWIKSDSNLSHLRPRETHVEIQFYNFIERGEGTRQKRPYNWSKLNRNEVCYYKPFTEKKYDSKVGMEIAFASQV
jgi:hypothetical protein